MQHVVQELRWIKEVSPHRDGCSSIALYAQAPRQIPGIGLFLEHMFDLYGVVQLLGHKGQKGL